MPPTPGFSRFTAYGDDSVTVARRLLGQRLVRVVDGQRLAGTIVEVEAYLGMQDAAAHTFKGRRTARNESMYLPGGHTYVYMIYGMHFCMNVVCGAAETGTAVLLRALEPTEGLDVMRAHRTAVKKPRRNLRDRDLCSGPGKLAQALRIDRSLDGEALLESDRLWIESVPPGETPLQIEASSRIGVAYAGEWAEKPLRFFLAGNPHVSH